MKLTVVKRSGNREPLAVEKWQNQVAKVCSGIADVSQSMIEIRAQPHFYDGITTREIDGITLRAIVDLIDCETNPDIGHTNYQYVAGKQRLSMLRKDVFGSYDPPNLYEIVKKNVEIGLYTKDLLSWYTIEDWNKMNDIIDKIVYNYNHTVNRGIGYKPVDVNDFIENKIRQEKKTQGLKVEYEDFKVGQYVRVLNEREI